MGAHSQRDGTDRTNCGLRRGGRDVSFPGRHQAKDGAKAFTMSRKRILDARRHLSVDLAADDLVALQFSQLLRKHFLVGPERSLWSSLNRRILPCR